MFRSTRVADLQGVAIPDRVEVSARAFARTWSLLAIGAFVVLGATVGIPRGPDMESWERTTQLATLGLIAFGVLVAHRFEGIGGAIMLVGGAALGGMAALEHQPLVAFIPAAVFIAPAVAFLIAWKRTKSLVSLIVLGAAVITILSIGGAVAYANYQTGYGPSHPQSTLPPLPDTPVVWMWAGGVSDTSAVVVARIDGDAATLELNAGLAPPTIHYGTATAGTWRFALTGLEPLTTYAYQFVVDGQPQPERTGEFTTFSNEPMSFQVAFASCARLGSAGKVFETILATNPDLFISTGDFFYADYVATAAQLADAYNRTLTSPPQAALYGGVPIAYMWDDHDYGGNDSDSTAPSRTIALEAYDTFVPHYPLTETEAINQAFTIGRVRFILLDGRSSHDPDTETDTPAKSMLGAAQLVWLENELLSAHETHALVVVATSVPWIQPATAGADDWGGFTNERRVIADFIADHGIDNLLMIAGDAHMLAIDDGTNTNYSNTPGPAFPLFQAAALDRPGSYKGGPYSEGAHPGGGQFGLISVMDNGVDLAVTLTGYDWTGATIIEYSFEVGAR